MIDLGVIGGVGPLATAYFLELIAMMTKAQHDHEHLNIIIYDYASIPDRTDFILNKCENNPLIPMINIAKMLEQQGVEYIAIPCITAHYFYDALSSEVNVPIINIVKEIGTYLKENKIKRIGITATSGTIESHFLQRQFSSIGVECILPSKKSQEYLMDLIYKDVKAGKPVEMDKFYYVSNELKKNGAQAILLGCTELSLIKKNHLLSPFYIDALEILAKACIISCNRDLKEQYNYLISNNLLNIL